MKRNIMLLLCGAALTASAQTDVTADYLTHYDFDSGFHLSHLRREIHAAKVSINFLSAVFYNGVLAYL